MYVLARCLKGVMFSIVDFCKNCFSCNVDASITNRLRQTFLENLLGTYRELERSFMEKIYELHKALGFRTLWKLDDLMGSFRRIASESALGTGRLNGAVELTKVLLQLSEVITKAESCFSKLRYSKSVHKWSFDNFNDKQVFVGVLFVHVTLTRDPSHYILDGLNSFFFCL